ncbi:hypothetical protein P4645_15500 [Lysinibacillus fusiformis]|uniref:hypothetical protein n=1 Tax=Lysinibacillus fusiformis TaxID=28031 RepID=UPI002E1FF98F|nr:hypothetical protein [Lysinibacillus fusiformis]
MIVDIILERRRNEYLNFVQLSKSEFIKTRLIFTLVAAVFFGGMGWYFLNGFTIIVYLIAAVGALAGYKYPYLKLGGMKKTTEEKLDLLFSDFLQAYAILQPTKENNMNVFQASLPFVQEPLHSGVERLADRIRVEGDKREIYMEFAEYVNTPDAYTFMDQFYKFSVEGYKDEALTKLLNHVREIQKNRMAFVIKKKFNSMENFGLLPLLCGTVFILLIIFTILLQEFTKATSMF